MPEISRFLGIVIAMYRPDHGPPHFHVRYAGRQAKLGCSPPSLLAGDLPPRVIGLVDGVGGASRGGIGRELAPRRESRTPGASRAAGVTMLVDVTEVEVLTPYRLHLRFDDGSEGDVDVAAIVPFEGVFAPLRDASVFAAVRVDAELGTVVWPNGADLDPEILYARALGLPDPGE